MFLLKTVHLARSGGSGGWFCRTGEYEGTQTKRIPSFAFEVIQGGRSWGDGECAKVW